ncbi:ABC transporter substrate-binding protein [Microtetraspora niveoalba]|uniref:ABC transporter substrate-binding protein n=1 Tax=Microtetraspora niveoalba TaxID=46175 RepID=UPI000830A3A8|nr:ABC transporter substrate-binding protein [Microtetraspora niveoalba]
MMHNSRRGRMLALAAVATLALGVTAACGSDDEKPAGGGSSAAAAGPVTITLQTFGGGENFAYDDAVKAWNASHPNIQVKYVNLTDRFEDTYLPQMLQWLESGAGAGDIIGMDEGGMGLMGARPQYFADLGQYGLDSRKADFPEYKWNTGINKDGKLFAIGTDIGGMAMCYRTDLFKKAGLPTDRDEVSKLWPDWNSYLEVGKKLTSALKGVAFVDGANTVYNSVLSQETGKNGNVQYFDKDNNLILDKNPGIKASFDYVQTLSKAGLTAKLRSWTEEWNTAMQKGQFATMGCPSWMLGTISGTSGDANSGNWDVAAVPGGSGNWGGSWLMVPAQSKHPKEAAEVLNYLTSKEGQIAAFKEGGNFPSNIQAQQDPTVAEAKNAYFNDAPSGPIFADSVSKLSPVFFGEKHAQVKAAVEEVLVGADQGSIKWDEAWQRFIDEGVKAAG